MGDGREGDQVVDTDEKGTRRSFDPKSGAVYALGFNSTGERLGVLGRLNLRVGCQRRGRRREGEFGRTGFKRGRSSGAVALSQ